MNLNFDIFTYVVGLAGILGLILQLKDSFPEHREARKTIVLIVIGIFVGSIITSLEKVKVDYGVSIRPFEILVAVFAVVLSVSAVVGVFTKESVRRTELFVFSGVGAVFLFVVLAFGNMDSVDTSRAEREFKQVNIEELLDLSTLNTSHGNYERALLFLQQAKTRLPQEDQRRKILDDRIQDVKRKQVGEK